MLQNWGIKPTSSPRESNRPPERTAQERALVSTAFGGAGCWTVTCQARMVADTEVPKCSSRTT